MSQVLRIFWDDFHTVLGSSRFGSGVNHRARQVGELLGRVNAEVMPLSIDATGVSKPSAALVAAGHLRAYLRATPRAWRSAARQGRRLAAAINALEVPHGMTGCVVWGEPDNWVVPVAACVRNLPLVAVPCDFGIGLDDGVRAVVQPKLIGNTSTFCISECEQWLLRGSGVEADYLPYRPAGAWLDELMAIRARRGTTSPTHDLVLTSFTNPYNRQGMRQLACLVNGLDTLPRPMIVGGYESERYAGWFNSRQVRFEGSLSDARLTELMAAANCVVLDQHYGGGVSTRIVDALTAGIPVVATRVAARSCTGLQGVHLFETAAELATHLRDRIPTPPLPAPDHGADQRFVRAVLQALGQNS